MVEYRQSVLYRSIDVKEIERLQNEENVIRSTLFVNCHLCTECQAVDFVNCMFIECNAYKWPLPTYLNVGNSDIPIMLLWNSYKSKYVTLLYTDFPKYKEFFKTWKMEVYLGSPLHNNTLEIYVADLAQYVMCNSSTLEYSPYLGVLEAGKYRENIYLGLNYTNLGRFVNGQIQLVNY